MINLYQEVVSVSTKYPSLSISKTEDGYILKGILVMNKTYDEVPLYHEFNIEIQVPNAFPNQIPKVFAAKEDIPVGFQHFLVDGELCLGAMCELRTFLTHTPSLTAFIDELLMSYLYAAEYYRTYGIAPYGERSHGIKGTREAYKERYRTDDDHLLNTLLLFLSGYKKYRGHCSCPCGSGQKFRDCHGTQLIQDIRSPYYEEFKEDAINLLCTYYENIKKRQERRKWIV